MNSSIAVVILSTGVGFGLSSVTEVAWYGKGFTMVACGPLHVRALGRSLLLSGQSAKYILFP
jgi:hypothetical protein